MLNLLEILRIILQPPCFHNYFIRLDKILHRNTRNSRYGYFIKQDIMVYGQRLWNSFA